MEKEFIELIIKMKKTKEEVCVKFGWTKEKLEEEIIKSCRADIKVARLAYDNELIDIVQYNGILFTS